MTDTDRSNPTRIDVACPACLGDGRPGSLVVEGQFRLVRCQCCRTQYFRPDASLRAGAVEAVSEYWEKYKFAMYADPEVRRDYEKRYTAFLELAVKANGPFSSILDVGCGIGNFVAFAAATGRAAYGVDVDSDAVDTARDRGLAVALADEVDEVVDQPLDAVTMWDVIEHLYEPEPIVRRTVERLRPGGTLILETPDASFPLRSVFLSLHAMTRGRADLTRPMYYWEHKIYFTEAGLRALLDRCGCTVVAVRRVTSPQAKMRRIFERRARNKRGLQYRIVAWAWPALERGFTRLGTGNKLILVARR